ncbi:MAG: (2Fe-2S)-binding protein [Synergistaceae bacterium]|nr:(2Fe-2S)-binding protein [Synergistaceae bacterium]
MDKTIRMKINRQTRSFFIGYEGLVGEIPDEETLSHTLRERLNLTGTKEACGEGACGCCTVLLNSRAVPSCQILTADCDGADILTIEGLQDPATGELDPIQRKFIDKYAFQCGYCTPGIIMTLKGLFLKNPHPATEEIKEALSGNLCRCISHYHVIDAAEELARENV